MRTITSAVALSVFVTFFVWMSVLATQTSRHGNVGDRTLTVSGLPAFK
jgi:hypothetical protein